MIPRFLVRCAHRPDLYTCGGVRVHAPVARKNCMRASSRMITTRTKVAVTTTCACTRNRRLLQARTPATTTVRCCTVWSTKTQARWTRTTIRTLLVPCASTKRLRLCTCSGDARPVLADTPQYTMALSWPTTTRTKSLCTSVWTGNVRSTEKATTLTKTAVCCTRRRWSRVVPVRLMATTPRHHVRCVHPFRRTRQYTRGGARLNVPVAREYCTRVGLDMNTTRTKVVVPTSCACIPSRRSLLARTPATTMVRSFTVWSTKTQAQWTRITTRTLAVSFARK